MPVVAQPGTDRGVVLSTGQTRYRKDGVGNPAVTEIFLGVLRLRRQVGEPSMVDDTQRQRQTIILCTNGDRVSLSIAVK